MEEMAKATEPFLSFRRGGLGRRLGGGGEGGRVAELPVGVFRLALKRGIAQREAGDLERAVVGEAIDAGDAAVGRLDQAPLRVAGDRVRINAPQVPHGARLARILDEVGEIARVLARTGEVIALDRLAVLVADVQQLGLALAHGARLPDLADDGEAAGHDGDDEEHREVGEAVLLRAHAPALSRPPPGRRSAAPSRCRRGCHHVENSLPSIALPGAPLFTSNTPLFCGSAGGTTTQVAVLSVIGSSGTLRRYRSLASASSDSGYLPLSAWYLPMASRSWNRFSFSTTSFDLSRLP